MTVDSPFPSDLLGIPFQYAKPMLVVNDAGNVGIGSLSPSNKLEIDGDILALAGASIRLADADSTNYVGIRAPANVATDLVWTLPGSGYWTDQGTYVVAGNTSDVVITDAGNIGIGTTSPKSLLSWTVSPSDRFLNAYDVDANSRLILQGSSSSIELVDIDGTANDRWLQFASNNGLAKFGSQNDAGDTWIKEYIVSMDLSTGNVGIGTASPGAELTVTGNIDVEGGRVNVIGSSAENWIGFANGYYVPWDNPLGTELRNISTSILLGYCQS